MKRKLLFPALVLFFGAVSSPPAMGQYFNFAAAYTGNVFNHPPHSEPKNAGITPFCTFNN